MNILIADDSRTNLFLLQEVLKNQGYRVTTAINGAEALQKARQSPPDLIITDILMPVMDGLSLCWEWNRDERLKLIPLICYTGTYTDDRDRKFALKLGAARFIVNTGNPEDLIKAIQEVLETRKRGALAARSPDLKEETIYLKHHNESLTRKLEDKMRQLEQANRELQHDIAERKQAERELRRNTELAHLLEALARAANEATTPEAAMRTCLARICDYGNWMLGRVGIFAPGQPKSVPQSSLWHCPQPARFDEFMRISNTFNHTPPSGKFTNIALREKRPVWVSDFLTASGFGRLASAEKHGIRSGFVFPVVLGGEALAFLEFFADEVREPDTIFLEAIGSVSGQLARVIEREQSEETRAQLATIVESSNDAIVSRALDGTILTWNTGAEQLFGYTAAEMVGGNVHRLTPPDQAAQSQRIRAFVHQGHELSHYESVRVTRDGRRIDVSISGSPIRDAAGNVTRVALIFRDISERKRAEAQILKLNAELEQRVVERTRRLEAANKELEAFSYSVSHDLRAPLRGIDGFSQMLLKKYAGHLDATGSDYLQRIRRASVRMGELIDDLLQLSRVSRSQIRTEPVDLSRLARSILAELQDREPERKVVTEVQDGIEVSADPRLLKIALENLLGNAWKFTGKNSEAKIRFEASQQNGELIVSVKDNGAGFNPKYAHKLFGAFQRLHNATEFEGTGIGLATVQRIIHLHGGRVWADATMDKGATFYFAMPRATRNDITTTPQGEAA